MDDYYAEFNDSLQLPLTDRHIWTTKDKRVLFLDEMSISHLENTLNYLNSIDLTEMAKYFIDELDRRKSS